MKKLFSGINGKLILLISAILCVTILVIFASTFLILGSFQKKTVGQALSRTELLVNSLITSKLQELKVQSQLVGELPILNTAVENGDASTIQDIGRTYRDNLGAAIFDILGRNGELIASINGNLRAGDSLVAALAERVLEEGALSTVFPRGGNLVLLGAAPIGTSEDAGGVLLVGTLLDSTFATQVRDFTKSEITFLVDGRARGSSLPAEERAGLESMGGAQGDWSRFASKSLTLSGMDGATMGQALIQLPLEEHRQMLSALRLTLAGIGGLVFLLACAVTLRFSLGFTRPIAEAVRFAQKLAAGDRGTPIDVNRTDELGSLQNSLESMRVALNELIENLDAKVKAGIRHVTNILDNLDGGFLIFDKGGTVLEGYSRVSETYFGEGLAGKKLEEVLRIDPAHWGSVQSWREILFGGILPFKDAVPLGPGSYEKLEGRYIELAYRPIYSGSALEGVILIATDKTLERELFRKFEMEKERVDMIIKITTNREAFLDFLRESKGCIADIAGQLGRDGRTLDVDAAFRAMHTLKGNSAMYSCTRVRVIAHALESDLSEIRARKGRGMEEYQPKLEAGLAALEDALAQVVRENRTLLGSEAMEAPELRLITVSDTLLAGFEKALLQHFRKESMIYRMFQENLVLEPVLPPLKKYEAMAVDLARRREKRIKPILWDGDDVKARIGAYKRLFASMIHAFRNAIDHGIEVPELREEGGKDPEGCIRVGAEKLLGEEGPWLRIRVRDDGKGIDPGVIRRKAVEKGLLQEDEAIGISDREVIQLVFRSGFSTAETVSEVSGRGVGMDAIAYEARKLGGKAWIESEVGRGSELTVEVPFVD